MIRSLVNLFKRINLINLILKHFSINCFKLPLFNTQCVIYIMESLILVKSFSVHPVGNTVKSSYAQLINSDV